MSTKKTPQTVTIQIVPKKEVDPRIVEQAKKRMDWAMGFMVVRYHFVYQILAMMTKRCLPGIGAGIDKDGKITSGTMGVTVHNGGSFELVYDPEFVLNISDANLTYVLYHEIMHLALHHCTHRKFDDHRIGNIATDLAVNELIPTVAGSCEPPKDGCFVSELKKKPEFKDIKEKQTSEWYYDYLKKKQKEQQGKGKGKGTPQDGKGDQSGNSFDDHGGWKEDEIADQKVRAKIDEIAKNNQWGEVGSTEQELILAAQVKRINWRKCSR